MGHLRGKLVHVFCVHGKIHRGCLSPAVAEHVRDIMHGDIQFEHVARRRMTQGVWTVVPVADLDAGVLRALAGNLAERGGATVFARGTAMQPEKGTSPSSCIQSTKRCSSLR